MLQFRHVVIDPDPPGKEHDITLLFDMTGNGKSDIFIAGKSGEMFWYENPSWKRRIIGNTPDLEAGGVVLDINGNGLYDLVAGTQYNHRELYWFENPGDIEAEWKRYLITDQFQKYHDQSIGDVDGDGKDEILFSSQQSGVIGYIDIPEDLSIEPWPVECFHLVAEDMPGIEGLQVVDIDGDGVNEILAGPNIFKRDQSGNWNRTCFAEDFVMTRVKAADVDGDGSPEIVLCEGESNPGRLAVCKGPDFKPVILRDDLFHPHSIEVLDFTGDGNLDVFIGEMGLGKHDNPRMFIYENDGEGKFTEHIISEGIPTHEAKAADLTGNGLPDIVGKPYEPERHIDVWFNEILLVDQQ